MTTWNRWAQALFAACFALSAATGANAACFASYAVAGTSLNKIANPSGPVFRASGDATAYTYVGNVDWGCQLVGTLNIICSEAWDILASNDGTGLGNIVVATQYFTYGDPGCARAHWTYGVVGTTISGVRQSEQRCVRLHGDQ